MRAKSVVGTAILGSMLVASLLFGRDPGPCVEAYRVSALAQTQMHLKEFRDFYAGDVCSSNASDPSSRKGVETATDDRQVKGGA